MTDLPPWDARSPAFLGAVHKALAELATHPQGRVILAIQRGDYGVPPRPGDLPFRSGPPQGFAGAERAKRGGRGRKAGGGRRP
jgi:hypothetical protein